MQENVRRVGETIGTHLEKISKMLGPNYEVCFVARYTKDDLDDADILITNDDPDKVVATIERLKGRDFVTV